MINKFFLKFLLFTIILYIIQIIFTYFYPSSLGDTLQEIQKYKDNHIDVIYFGDSSVYFYSKKDKDKRATFEVLNELLGNKYKVEMLGSAAWQAEVFSAYAKYMKQQNFLPRYVIIPINLRSFAVGWDYWPAYQFTGDLTYFRYYNTPLYPFINIITNFSLADVNQKYQYLFENSTVYDGYTPVGKASKFENLDNVPYDVRFKKKLIYFYFSYINSDHRKLRSILQISDTFKNTNTKVIFYITPIDYQTGEKYYPNTFKQRIAHNVKVITSELQKKGATVLDLSLGLDAKDFTWSEQTGNDRYMNEHINNHGKYFISSEIARVIDKLN